MKHGCAVEMELSRHLADWDEREAKDLAIERELRRLTEDACGFLDLIEGMTGKERESLDTQLAHLMTASHHDPVGMGRIQERMQKLFEAVIQRDLEREAKEYG